MSDRRALLVATNRYDDADLSQLRGPAADVDALRDVLADPAIGDFEVLDPLVDRPSQVVREAIEGFFSSAGSQDTLLLYLSCHGRLSPDGRQLYFAMSDTKTDRLRSTAIGDDFVIGALGDCLSHRVVLMLDCCHSGRFARGSKGDRTAQLGPRFGGRGQVTLTASDELEYAWEADELLPGLQPRAAGSRFTRTVVEGLKSGDADLDQDGHVSVDELYRYVHDRMARLRPPQRPMRIGEVKGELIIANSTHQPRLPSEILEALASPLAGVRKGVVAELDRLRAGRQPTLAAAAEIALYELLRDDSRMVSAAAEEVLEGAGEDGVEKPSTPAAGQNETTSAAPAVTTLLRRAQARQARGCHADAIVDFDAVLERSPHSAEALSGRGLSELRLHRYEKALADLNEALRLDEEDAVALAARGRVRLLLEDAGAFDDLKRALELDPQLVEPRLAHAFAHFVTGSVDAATAIGELERALELEPDNPEALALLALLGSPSETDMDIAGRAVEADPRCAFAIAVRGAFRVISGDPQGDDDLERARTLDSDDPMVRVAGAVCFIAKTEWEKAEAELDHVVRVLPRSAWGRVARGSARVERGRLAEALEDFEAALRSDTRAPDALAGRGLVLQRLGRDAEALTDLDLALADAALTDPSEARVARGWALLSVGRWHDGLTDFDAALDGESPPFEAHLGRARALCELRRRDESVEALNRARELDPTSERLRQISQEIFLAYALEPLGSQRPGDVRARQEANRSAIEKAPLEKGWYKGMKNDVLGRVTGAERLLWLCRCSRSQDFMRSTALLVASEQLIWCRETMLGGDATGGSVTWDAVDEITEITGGFKLKLADGTSIGFNQIRKGIDLIGTQAEFDADGVRAIIKRLVERASAT